MDRVYNNINLKASISVNKKNVITWSTQLQEFVIIIMLYLGVHNHLHKFVIPKSTEHIVNKYYENTTVWHYN